MAGLHSNPAGCTASNVRTAAALWWTTQRYRFGAAQIGDVVILIGETGGHLGASLYLREIEGREAGPPPPVDLAAERRNGDFVRSMIRDGLVAACHDVSDGGLLVALAEMAIAAVAS